MNTLTVLFVCIQACLLQITCSQYLEAFAPAAIAPSFASAPLGYIPGYSPCAAAQYGGSGEGNVAVAGELPVAGNTVVAGNVPIMGAVSFSGPVPAAGAVSVAGQCACGCGALPVLF